MAKPENKTPPTPTGEAASDPKGLEKEVKPLIKLVSFTDASLTTRLEQAAEQATEFSAATAAEPEVYTRTSQMAFKIAMFNFVSDMYAVSDEAYAQGFAHIMSTPTWFPSNPSQAAKSLGWRNKAAKPAAAAVATVYVAKRKTVE